MIGYLTAWNSKTIINHTTQRGLNIITDSYETYALIYQLSDGTKVNFNGSTQAKLIPGQITQDIKVTTGGKTIFDSFKADQGKSASATFTPLSGAAQYADAVLLDVIDITPIKISTRAKMNIRLLFDIQEPWSGTP